MTVTIKNGWVAEAIGIYYTDKTFGPFTQPVKFGVIHATASPGASAQNIATNWHNTPTTASNAVSAHIIINKDGTYVQGMSLDNSCWGNGNNTGGASYLPPGNPNLYTVSIEHCKDDPTYNSDAITPEQQASSFELWDAICAYHNIARQVITVGNVSAGGLIRHADIDPVNRQFCPGPYPFSALQSYLQGDPMFSNSACVRVWETFPPNKGNGPSRGTGLFTEWRRQWVSGHYKGAPSSGEYPYPLADGTESVAQNYGSSTAVWNNANPYWL